MTEIVAACCMTCTAFKAINDELGVCRAHPPVPVLLGVAEQPSQILGQPNRVMPQLEYYQPIVLKTRWCREFEAKAKADD